MMHTATSLIYTLSLHDALPISPTESRCTRSASGPRPGFGGAAPKPRSEEHTSELQSRENLVCRLLLEKKKTCMYCCCKVVIRNMKCILCHTHNHHYDFQHRVNL